MVRNGLFQGQALRVGASFQYFSSIFLNEVFQFCFSNRHIINGVNVKLSAKVEVAPAEEFRQVEFKIISGFFKSRELVICQNVRAGGFW